MEGLPLSHKVKVGATNMFALLYMVLGRRLQYIPGFDTFPFWWFGFKQHFLGKFKVSFVLVSDARGNVCWSHAEVRFCMRCPRSVGL